MSSAIRKLTPFIALCALLAVSATAQNNRPVDKRGFFKVLRDHSLPADELAQIVKERGVDFTISSDEEKEVLSLGGDAVLVDAVKAGFKAPPKAEVKLPDGPPLAEKEILLLLEGKVDQDVVLKLIEKRGTTFAMDKDLAVKFSSAGANSAVIGTLLISQREVPKPVAPPEPVRTAQVTPKPENTPALTPPPQVQTQASPQAPTVVNRPVNEPKPPEPVKTVAANVPTPPAASSSQQPLRVDVYSQAQKLKSTVKPVYPVSAQRMKIQGRVAVEVLINRDGSVENAHTVAGHPQLARAAEDAVRKWKWEPTLINGQPVEVVSQVVMDFKIASN